MGSAIISHTAIQKVAMHRPSQSRLYQSPSSIIGSAPVPHTTEFNTQREDATVLVDITSRSLNLASDADPRPASSTISTLTINRRSSWTSEGFGKKRRRTLQGAVLVVGGGRKVYRVKRRDAISLTEEQAKCLARSLSRLSTPTDDRGQESCPHHDIAGRNPKREQHEPEPKEKQHVAELTIDQLDTINIKNDRKNAPLLPFKTLALQPNLFLITRTDGLALTYRIVPTSTL